MPYLARKITRAKWESGDELGAEEIPADAVTVDLRTTSNALSFWKLEKPSDEEIRLTALALATGADRIDRLDLAWVEEVGFHNDGLSLNPNDGRTPVVSLRKNHVDVTKLDLDRICKVAVSVSQAISRGQHQRFTKRELVKIIVEAVINGLLSPSDLAPNVKEEIEKELGNPTQNL